MKFVISIIVTIIITIPVYKLIETVRDGDIYDRPI